MSEYRLPREILGMVGNELAISTIDIGTFGMARDLYGNCIPTQIFEIDKLRFPTKPKRSKRMPAYPAKFSDIKGLAHWLYKRCEPSKRDSYKAHYENILQKNKTQQEQIQNEIKTVIKEFESTQNVRTASKSLERIWGGDAFIVSTLFLSTAFSDTISFLSPELTYCFNLDTGLKNDESEFSRDARLHDALQTCVEKTIERFSPKLITRPEVEQVAYVLRLLAKLKDSYYEPGLVSRQGPLRRDGIIFKAKVKNRNNNPFPDVSRPLAMKEQSIIGDHRIIDYLNEVKISSELNCVNVIAFHGWTYTNQHIRIVMDRMKTDLENRLKDHRKWNKRNSRHDPDSKPLLNIFLDKEDNVVLGDFGVSKQARDGNETTLATFTGTTAYIAPEVLGVRRQDTAYTSKADVWALGCVLYRMLSGHPLIKDHNDKDEVITAVNNFKEKRIVKPRRLPKVPTKCQYEFLDGLLDCTVNSRLSVTDALSQCSVWKDY